MDQDLRHIHLIKHSSGTRVVRCSCDCHEYTRDSHEGMTECITLNTLFGLSVTILLPNVSIDFHKSSWRLSHNTYLSCVALSVIRDYINDRSEMLISLIDDSDFDFFIKLGELLSSFRELDHESQNAKAYSFASCTPTKSARN